MEYLLNHPRMLFLTLTLALFALVVGMMALAYAVESLFKRLSRMSTGAMPKDRRRDHDRVQCYERRCPVGCCPGRA